VAIGRLAKVGERADDKVFSMRATEASMEQTLIQPGEVDWSGENPGMYLRASAAGPFVTLISFFRVVLSPHGKGHAAFMLFDPFGDGRGADKPNLCITDNEPLAEYLRKGFVAHFGAFKGASGLERLRVVPGWDFIASGDAKSVHTEWFRSVVGQVQLTWGGLEDSYYLRLPKEKSATGKHVLLSLFVDSREAGATINGVAAPGRAFPREFAGKADASTAFLAFSETWLK
jgi:hypothetical protein